MYIPFCFLAYHCSYFHIKTCDLGLGLDLLYLFSPVKMIKFLCRAPEIDISELESLFSAASDGSGTNKAGVRRGSNINKPEKVQLVIFSQIFFITLMLLTSERN